MSGHHQAKKKTVAQLRAEKEQRERDFDLGWQLADDMIDAAKSFASDSAGSSMDVHNDTYNAFLVQANWAVSLLQNRPDTHKYRLILGMMADIHRELGQFKLAEATFWQADEAFAMAERNGSLTARGYDDWMMSLIQLGLLYLNTQQLESAKRCFLRVLDMPHQRARDRGGALQGLADYYKLRKDWPAVIECCEKALLLIPEAEEELRQIGRLKERLLLSLADAAEAQGDMGLARRYDEKAKKVPTWKTSQFPLFVACDRREALKLLALEKPNDAVRVLSDAPKFYYNLLLPGINFTDLELLKPVLAALKVLMDALVQTGDSANIHNAELLQAQVGETEAILSGYWESVLEETRRELREQQRAGGLGAAGAGKKGTEGKKKSKAAKRKQQKRKAQQQKRAAEMAEAAAAAAVEGGGGWRSSWRATRAGTAGAARAAAGRGRG